VDVWLTHPRSYLALMEEPSGTVHRPDSRITIVDRRAAGSSSARRFDSSQAKNGMSRTKPLVGGKWDFRLLDFGIPRRLSLRSLTGTGRHLCQSD
jgi:hypothetical protein